jgi:hypothetical protein
MAGSSFGTIYRLSTFGESHGIAMGGVIDGCPSGISLDIDLIQAELDRRKPGQNKYVTERKEADEVIFLSGYLKVKRQEHQLDLPFRIKIKIPRIIHTSKTTTGHLMRILRMKKNMAFEIIEEEGGLVREKLYVALSLVLSLNRSCKI